MRTLRIGYTLLFTNFLLVSFTSTVFSQSQYFTKIDSVVSGIMTDNKIVGISIGIVKDGKIFYTKGYGTKQIGTVDPIDSTTNFLTCSITKLFTATAIMQLVEEGKIDISKKLTHYIPDFEMKDLRYKEITIEQILTHTSGLPNIWKNHFINPIKDSLALTEFACKLKEEKLSFAPGVQLSEKTYSNTGYDILGLVIERVTHQTYSHYVTANVLIPAGMNRSSFFIDSIEINRRSFPHRKNWLTGKIKVSNYYPDIPQDKPCGNLNSCAYDLCKWMIHNLSIYNATNSKGVVKTSTLQDMWTTKRNIPSYKTSVGLGWWIYDSEKYGKYLFHVGNDPGYSGTLLIFPESNIGIVVLCNALFPKEIVWNKIPFDILDTLLAD